MKLLANTLKLHISTWDDPGDYPSGAGSCPLLTGRVVVHLEQSDIDSMEGDLSRASVESYLADNARSVPHEEPGLVVKSWDVESVDDGVVMLKVDEFEVDVPERDY